MEFDSKLFQTENVPTTWLMTALCIAPIALYGIFRMLSARMRRFAELSIEAVSKTKARRHFGGSPYLDCNNANA